MENQESRFEILKHEGWTRQFIANEHCLNEDQYKIIYTRQKDEVAELDDDLF